MAKRKFKKGDYVVVIDEKAALDWDAEVVKGERGVVTGYTEAGNCCVNLDGDPVGKQWPWKIPEEALELVIAH